MTHPAFTIDTASPKDTDGVTRVLQASFPELMRPAYPPAVLERALPHMTLANRGLLESGRYFVARSQTGDIVGCGGWSFGWSGDTAEPALAHLRHFATHARWTRRGIGRALFEASFAQARAAGATAFEVRASLNAEVFYASLGLRRVEIVSIDLGGGATIDSVRMRLDW